MKREDNIGIKYDAKKLRWDLLPLDIYLDMKSYIPMLEYNRKDILTLVKENNWLMLGAFVINSYNVTGEELVDIYTQGAERYGDNNWKQLEFGKERYKAALLRHLMVASGFDVNPDFNIKHAAHAVWNCIALQWFAINK